MSDETTPEVIRTMQPGAGVAIQCQYCMGRNFRRSRLRRIDWRQLLWMRYPVRCLRCSQRQWVSFTVAGLSLPSHAKHVPEKVGVARRHAAGGAEAAEDGASR